MRASSLFRSLTAAAITVGLLVVANVCFYNIPETEQVILTQFGKTVGSPLQQAGVHFKWPFVQTVNRIDKRILEWDGRASEMPTRDKLYIVVDTFGRWRISDPLQFFTRLRDERSALSRLDDIIGSEVRNALAKHDLIEIVRTDKNRKPAVDPELVAAGGEPGNVSRLLPISVGRAAIEVEIVAKAAPKLKDFGIELIDVRFMRVNYNPSVSSKIHERMMSERQQIASRFRSEGEGEAAKIIGSKERDLRQIESESYREVQKIKGEADARASEIYARAYGGSPEAAEFFQFTRTMEAYRTTFDKDTTLILSTDSEFFRYLKQVAPSASPVAKQ